MARKRVTPGDPKVCCAYVRCSTEEQQLGPQAQRQAIERWAAAQGMIIASWHEDLGLSGGLPADRRPGLLAALGALGERGAGVLVAAKRDRIARDVVVAAAIERFALAAGARVATADGTSSEDTPEAFLMRTIMDAFAQYERLLIKARTRAALGVKKSRGERVGSVPFGYRLAADGVQVEHHEAEAIVAARICGLRAEGLTFRAIVARLNVEGVPARGRRWHLRTVQRVLSRQPAA